MVDNIITIENLSFSFDEKLVLENINLEVKRGSITGLLGPNGCGKTTILRLLSKLLICQTGNFRLDNANKSGFVFQIVEQNLIPWKNVVDNIILPFNKNKTENSNLKTKVSDILKEFNIEEIALKFPNELSGGQKQIVSLIRWLIFPIDLLFIDEGWTMLDIIQKEKIHSLIKRISTKNQTTVLLVSHNIEDISMLCNEVFLMTSSPGKIADKIVLNNDYIKNTEILWTKAKKVFHTTTKD